MATLSTNEDSSTMALARKWPWPKLLVMLACTIVIFVLYLRVGSETISPVEVIKALFHRAENPSTEDIVWKLRLPRACACIVVGAMLSLVGSAFQALFRNPLAEPYIVGVSSGSAVGGALAFVTGFGSSWEGFASGLGPMMAAVPTGLLSLILVFTLARRRSVLDVQTLLLAGVVIGSMLSALLSLILLAGGQDQRKVLQWLLGSMTPMYWNWLAVMTLVLCIGSVILVAQSRRLNVFALGEDTAQRLGVNTQRLKPTILITGTAMVAVTVGAVGIIGFLGLVAPHIARRLLGVDWRWSLLGSGILGSGILLISDLLAQRLVSNAEIPVGIVTAVVGAPFLLVILKKSG